MVKDIIIIRLKKFSYIVVKVYIFLTFIIT